ncbi:MAG: phosphoethanolamine transferase [Prevotella sp.]|nr:phosphoethanolamine transferase [Prevotella sp.]
MPTPTTANPLRHLASAFWKRARQTAEWVFAPIRLNAAFFVFLFVAGYLCTQLEVLHHKGAKPPYELAIPELCLDLYLLCTLLLLIPRRARRYVRALLAAVLYAVTIVDVFCFVKFKSTLTPTMLLLVGETNGNEAGEFLRSYIGWDVVASPLGWVLLVVLAHLLWAFVPKRLLPTGGRPLRPLLGLATLAMLVWSALTVWPNKQAIHRLMTKENIGEVEHELTRKDKAELYVPPYRLAFSIYANRLAARQLDRLLSVSREMPPAKSSFRSPNIVFIIGESYNRHHSQLYGYAKPTTPRQQERAGRGELTAFTDVVAPWNLTSFVFKHVLSLYAVGDSAEWCDYPLFPQLFRSAGYRVTFITNQFLPKAYEAVYDFSGGFFLNHPELSAAMFDIRNERLYRYDSGVLKELDNRRDTLSRHQLTIVHLMGQHVNYKERYPKTRRHLTADDYADRKLTKKDKMILADYDNAVLYNDSIVDQILHRYEHEEAIVVYMPDHGEECFGNDMHVYGRLHSADITRRLAHEEFEIPFWIWCSDSYRERHPDIIAAIRAAKDRPLMTDNVAQLLMGLAGIKSRYYRPDYDLLSPQYNVHRPRILKHATDYDRLRKE